MNPPPIYYCPFTGISISDLSFINGNYSYSIPIENQNGIQVVSANIKILLPVNYTEWTADVNFYNSKYILAGILLNGELFEPGEYWHQLSLENLKKALEECSYPKTPQEKYNNLFLKVFSLQQYDGQEIYIYDENLYKKLFFKGAAEMAFYAKSLHEDGLIYGEFIETTSRAGGELIIRSLKITYKGLSYALKLHDEGIQSKNCFIAMSFGGSMGDVRKAIKDACIKTDFIPVLVDEMHYDSDTTINDAIIAALRKSRFCIADFTEQKDGVYFESGFALGQGKQVIYTCRADWFNKSHFDTNHFPHIVYGSTDELTDKLIDKIEAWIR